MGEVVVVKKCGYCDEPCKGYASITNEKGAILYYHHGDDEWDDDGSPSCYEKAQWYSHEEDSLLDYMAQPKERT